jgi:hypothetical protein
MDMLVILDGAAPLLHAGKRVVIRMCHHRLPQKCVTVFFVVVVARVELKVDSSLGNIDVEFTVGAVVVFTAAMFLFKKSIEQVFNAFAQ